ncbi:TlpA family protein disulfide reductase [Clostridium botulinum]|nr:TlpA family protein disulfide reductase [Clostridium botulinum]NFN46985.1 TlpA family protein disulfide reductase [Clostridium botulinum]
MKKLISLVLIVICMMSLVACGNEEVAATVEPFPKFQGVDFKGSAVNNEIFKDYDATIVNFWSNSCGSCIEEMPELEEYYQEFKDKNINLITVAVSAGESDELRVEAETILKEKGVTYTNVIPDIESSFYKDFIGKITGYPTTYIVDGNENIIGAPIIGVVKNQEDTLMKRLEMINK